VTTLPWDEMINNSKDDGKQRVPDGTYECIVKSTEVGQTANGYKRINTRFIVDEGPYKGSSVFNNFIITPDKPGGMDLFFRNMGALGLTKDVLAASKPSLEALAEMMKDRRAELTVGTRVFNGKEYDDVKQMKPLGNPGGGFSFGGDTILPPVAVNRPSTPVPSALPPVPTVTDAMPTVMPVPPASDENGLPPEPPF
jgi:hypothetical protein